MVPLVQRCLLVLIVLSLTTATLSKTDTASTTTPISSLSSVLGDDPALNKNLTGSSSGNTPIEIAGYQREYQNEDPLVVDDIVRENSKNVLDNFQFGRFQSPQAIQRTVDRLLVIGNKHQTARRRKNRFQWFQGSDGRKGYVSCTKLGGGDWVLAESQQVAMDCTCHDVLRAYLSGHLQKLWNKNQVLDCVISRNKQTPEGLLGYKQDLVLHSQRVIRRHTGIMRYSQLITIDQVGESNYCVRIKLDPNDANSTLRKPFDALSVVVSLQQEGCDVSIYAAGVMKVNRKVVPNLVIFDASGIAGRMAGKGTLWLAAHFEQKRRMKANDS